MKFFLFLIILVLCGGGYYAYWSEQQDEIAQQQQLGDLSTQLDQLTKEHQTLLDQKATLDKSLADLEDENVQLNSKLQAMRTATRAPAPAPTPAAAPARAPAPAAPTPAATPQPEVSATDQGPPPYTGMLITDARIRAIKDRIDSGKEPQASAWRKCLEEANYQLNRTCQAPATWYVPARYVNNEAHQKAKKCLHDDANISFKLALVYRITGDERYAEEAARLINGWATTVKTFSDKDDSRLAFSYHIPSMIFAADLIRNSRNFPQADQDQFAAFLKDKGLQMCTMVPQPGIPVQNGHDWGLLFYLATGLYSHDETMVQKALETYKEYIGLEIKLDGILPIELVRNNGKGDAGFWYINFALMPLTITTELLRLHGTDLYDYTAPSGGNLRKGYEKVAQLMENPGDYPVGTAFKGMAPHSLDATFYAGYMEMLNTRWPNDEVTTVLQGKRPWDPDHSLPVTTLLYGDLPVKDGPSGADGTNSTDPDALPVLK